MDIYSYCCYIINCVLLFSFISCKSVSLNDIIAAEEKRASLQSPLLTPSVTETTTDRELPRNYKIYSTTVQKHIPTASFVQRIEKISPLKYKKTYQIKKPLRPKKLKYSYKPRNRRINSTTKREIDYNEKFNKNYIPLLKSLSVLFNNVLRTDSGSDDEEYYNKQRFNSGCNECPCATKSKYKTTDREPAKTTVTVTSSFTSTNPRQTEIDFFSETATTSTYNTFNDNISPFRRNKNVPILPARDSVGSWRNHNGFGEGSLSTYHSNFEGHIAGNNGSDENNNSGRETTQSYTENNTQHTNGGTGDDASCNGHCGAFGRNRYNTSITADYPPTFKTTIGSSETLRSIRRDSHELKGFDKFEAGRNKTKSRILLSQSGSRLRRLESQEETTEISWQIESPNESVIDLIYNYTRNQRISNRDGTVAPEDQEIRGANKKLTLNDLSTKLINASNSTQDKQKIVMIYDGYSIARDVNGENKMTEKGYRIHS